MKFPKVFLQFTCDFYVDILGDSGDDEGLEMLSRLFEEEVSQQEMLEQLILPVPSSVEEQVCTILYSFIHSLRRFI